MTRTIEFDPDEICDVCGKQGAFDFMGDCVCEKCMVNVSSTIETSSVGEITGTDVEWAKKSMEEE